MDIKDKSILVLGGFGLVGQAVIKRMMRASSEQPSHIVITSLGQAEAESAVDYFRTLYKDQETTFEPFWGNLFVRESWKDLPREAILRDAEKREELIGDVLGDLTESVVTSNTLYNAIEWARPDAIIDCINTSTAFAYQDLFTLGQQVRASLRDGSGQSAELVERLLASLYIPQLIRHVQILHRAMIDFSVRAYIKVGTSGTGGMGLNIPFTHSEERPSRMLLAKSSLAGAHSLLLFLMARTPRTAEIVKEIKPTATIAWKEIKYGPIRKSGKPIELEDVTLDEAEELGSQLALSKPSTSGSSGKFLESVYIDTGENGIFSKGEFETISALGQMEMVTPEEIAENVFRELVGASTGKDVVAALDASTMGPSYRAGYLRESALRMMTALEEETQTPSVAFEMLGPPRLAKLLFEAHLLKRIAKDFAGMLSHTPEELSQKAESILREDSRLRSNIISIGIPILLADGKKLVRGTHIKIPARRWETFGDESHTVELNDERRDIWAHDGWVDIRPDNMELWRTRIENIRGEAEAHGNGTGSETDRSPAYWNNFESLDEGRLAAWIFTFEEGGERIKR
ncbi:MAG TPA: short-chain dehydrogenase [Candidatus Kapabacteria bacterium]|nr:short-chain dehydrogenase [Candidatus Kapabacteria bacterium]